MNRLRTLAVLTVITGCREEPVTPPATKAVVADAEIAPEIDSTPFALVDPDGWRTVEMPEFMRDPHTRFGDAGGFGFYLDDVRAKWACRADRMLRALARDMTRSTRVRYSCRAIDSAAGTMTECTGRPLDVDTQTVVFVFRGETLVALTVGREPPLIEDIVRNLLRYRNCMPGHVPLVPVEDLARPFE